MFSFWSSLVAGKGALRGCGPDGHAPSVTPVFAVLSSPRGPAWTPSGLNHSRPALPCPRGQGTRISSAPFITGNFDCQFKTKFKKKYQHHPLVTCQVRSLQTSLKARVGCVINELLVVNCKHIHTSESYGLTFNLSTGKSLETKCKFTCQIDAAKLENVEF